MANECGDPKLTPERTQFRNDIQGLRAISVLAILFFHLDFHWIEGGFVGVDIFMVISGYLITKALLKDPKGGYFLPFWDRRIRRLFPALLFMLAFTYILAFLSLRPENFQDFTFSSLLSIFYTINFYLSKSVDYFDTAASLNYLLHTWSLAVEEQFYILLPLLLFFVRKSKFLLYWIILIWVLSFAINILIFTFGKGEIYAFYLLPARAWEFLSGSLIFICAHRAPKNNHVSALMTSVGLLLIGVALIFLDSLTPFPGYAALLPVVGVALIVFSGEKTSNVFHRFLAWPVFLYIGNISYSLYLVHWPITVFARRFYGEELLTATRAPILLALIFIAAHISWKYIETPFRHSAIPVRRFYTVIGVIIALFFVAHVLVKNEKGFPGRITNHFKSEVTESELDYGRYHLACSRAWAVAKRFNEACVFGDSLHKPSMIIWGDSHAGALAHGLNSVGRESGFSGYLATSGSCIPLKGSSTEVDVSCARKNEFVEAFILKSEEIETVIIHARWTNMFAQGSFGREGHNYNAEMLTIAKAMQKKAFRTQAISILVSTINNIGATGKKVLLIGPVPELGIHVQNASWIQSQFGFDNKFSLPRVEFNTRQIWTNNLLETIRKKTGATVIEPSDLLCGANTCKTQLAKTILYRDDDHLSVAGAKYLAEYIVMQLNVKKK